MKIKNTATSGTLQSNDCFIIIEPSNKLEIELNSPVKFEFEDQIIKVIKKVLEDKDIKNAYIKIDDRGALDCTIEARLISALRRSK